MSNSEQLNSTNETSSLRPIAVDLYAGAGGMSLGFEQAGFDVLAAIDVDPVHCAVHEFNFPHTKVICRSTTKITGQEIRDLSLIGDRNIDVVFGGPPCQGFSLMGQRRLKDSRNSLITHFLRLVVELQPKYFVMENVKGMTIARHRELLDELISQFKNNGYQVEENYRVLNAANYGVPQNRERLFLIGSKIGLDLPQYPARQNIPLSKKYQLDLPLTPTAIEAIGDLPEVNNYPELYERDWIVAEYGKPSDYAAQLRGLVEVQNDFSYPRVWDNRILTNSINTKHTQKSKQRFSQTKLGKVEPISKFHKLAPDGLCNTLRAGTARKRSAHTAARPIHYSSPRCITVREGARLHSYPDWFRFHRTKWHGFRQVGNSVPPLLAKAVAEEIIKALDLKPLKPTIKLAQGNSQLIGFTLSQASLYYNE